MTDAMLHAGYEIRAYPKRIASHDAAYITLHRLGDDGRGFLNPGEARTLAALLMRAAEEADRKEGAK